MPQLDASPQVNRVLQPLTLLAEYDPLIFLDRQRERPFPSSCPGSVLTTRLPRDRRPLVPRARREWSVSPLTRQSNTSNRCGGAELLPEQGMWLVVRFPFLPLSCQTAATSWDAHRAPGAYARAKTSLFLKILKILEGDNFNRINCLQGEW